MDEVGVNENEEEVKSSQYVPVLVLYKVTMVTW